MVDAEGLDVADLQSGMYLLVLKNDSGEVIAAQKFMKR
jgi:hypothetical protein